MYLQMHDLYVIDFFVHNTVNSLNLDVGHNLDELSEGGPSFNKPELMIYLSKSNMSWERTGIYNCQK